MITYFFSKSKIPIIHLQTLIGRLEIIRITYNIKILNLSIVLRDFFLLGNPIGDVVVLVSVSWITIFEGKTNGILVLSTLVLGQEAAFT